MSDQESPLESLHWDWGSAYVILVRWPDIWVAQRRDNRQTVTASGPEKLRKAIREDYQRSPVKR